MSQPERLDDLSIQQRVDEACLAFEQAWQVHLADPEKHPRPDIEACLAVAVAVDRVPLLRELLALRRPSRFAGMGREAGTPKGRGGQGRTGRQFGSRPAPVARLRNLAPKRSGSSGVS
jgi:hypothetical protein